ncbi:unnamed protein product [Rangifer tarandus platyrhynchus]|uniref:Uncharacterized protein n=2 Tax=Rangifer tarandus platyrhynchus TaxID=3082113 RepID=A0AC59YGB1_RANTA|nr:unnamed protein product [Rangifer tarandus platyrhynchus]
MLQVEGRSTHFEPGYLLIANILCLWLGVGQGCDGCQPPLGLDGGRGAEALATPRVLPAPWALVRTCHVCWVPRAQLGQGVGGGAAPLHLLMEKAVLSGGTRTRDSPAGHGPEDRIQAGSGPAGRGQGHRPVSSLLCISTPGLELCCITNCFSREQLYRTTYCPAHQAGLHVCQPREWCHHPVPLPSAPLLGVPTPCRGRSQTCELGRR